MFGRLKSGNSKQTLSLTDQRGFTIFETSMATFVMAFAIATSINVMQRAFLAVDTARGVSYAAQIMQSEIEKMRLLLWGDGASGAGSGTTGVTAYPTAATTVTVDSSFTSVGYIGSRFSMTRTTSTVHTGMIKVVLIISWKAYDGRLMSRSFIAYYGQNGLYDFVSA